MTGEEDLAVRQAEGAAAAARELLRGPVSERPCPWGDDAWHRAVSRLIRLHRPDYRRLLAEERDKTGEQL